MPHPLLPRGSSHALADSYYLTRDGRRECMPPAAAYVSGPKKLTSGEQT